MKNKEVILINETGLHARPASLFVKESNKFKSDVFIVKNDNEYNGKSIMNLLSLGAKKGDCFTIKTTGEDEDQALEVLVKLFEDGFGEQK